MAAVDPQRQIAKKAGFAGFLHVRSRHRLAGEITAAGVKNVTKNQRVCA
jgi:hypothetical protein